MGIVNAKRSTTEAYNNRLRDSFPAYYAADVVLNSIDEDLTTKSWNIVMSGTPTENFKAKKLDPCFHYSTSLSWFYDIFYKKLFELCPDVESMFENVSLVHQGKLLATVIGSALASLKKPIILKKRLIALAQSHNGKGVKAIHYCNMGLALFWSLEEVLGVSVMNEETRTSWVKMYSFMLNIIIPRVVKFSLGMPDTECDDENSSSTNSSKRLLQIEVNFQSIGSYMKGSSKSVVHPSTTSEPGTSR